MKSLIGVATVFLLIGLSLVTYAANNLVLYLPFDEGSGQIANDLSSFKNNCTLKGNPKWINGKYGKALELDGKTWGEVPDANSLDLTDSLTVEAWVKLYGGGEGTQSAIEKGVGWVDGEYNLAALYNNGTLLQMKDLPANCADQNVGSSIQDNTWHLLVGTWDGTVIKLYIDGKLDKDMACAGKLLTNNDPLFIGARGGAQRFIIGAIDEVKVYNYALSIGDIVKDMGDPHLATAVNSANKLAVTWSLVKAKF
jgi:hypothetical protein